MIKYVAMIGVLALAACSTSTYDPMKNNSDTQGPTIERFPDGSVLKTFPDGTKEFTVPEGSGLFF